MESKRYKIMVIGAGYVGLSLATLISAKHKVTIVEIDESKIELINKRISPIKDTGISDYFKNKTLDLEATTFDVSNLSETDYVIVCLPTNFDNNLGRFDTSLVTEICGKIAAISKKIPIIIKSTMPIGGTDEIINTLNLKNCFFSPEFLREGSALEDNLHPTRIIIGSKNHIAKQFSEILVDLAVPLRIEVILCSNKEAETIKLASNAYLACRIAFFNELDTLSEKLNLSSRNIIHGICADTRIGFGYNNPSFGYGGYCLPKDTLQLQSDFSFHGIKCHLLESITRSNDQRLDTLIEELLELKAKFIGIYRLQMKANSDNLRESSTLKLAYKLKGRNIPFLIFEPDIQLPHDLSNFSENNFKTFCNKSDVIIANRWSQELHPIADKVLCRDIYNEN
ncbi:nucleotide sugar dehydrogenase [Amylibacter sp.]|nr:nucleotide sugar dehydrogenase [Amylibacter sp.]